MADILTLALSSLKFVPKCYELLEERLLSDDIEKMRAAAVQSPTMVLWRARPGTEEHKKFKRIGEGETVTPLS